MAWEHLSIDKPHLVYIILGGFTTLFMLVSSIIKERLYIGEATVATICGIIFGPHGANLIDPRSWGNEDQITLEFSRIVLVVQCFAVGVELPKAYMERHWKSVTLLLVPVMTFGWLITSLFIWAMFFPWMNWLDSLCCAACVTATDPVLASSVVGKGKFAQRVPKHLRDLLSAESGCNDGMAFPFIYLAIYIIRYKHQPDHVALHWFCYTILYECIFGATYGVIIGYLARRAIRFSEEKRWIDRESFLVFYFVLALFCAGSGSLLGMDDLLVGFACGVGFSNDGWFSEKTEESHVSNVIDLLINLAFFVYFGTIIPWDQYNSGVLGLKAWRLVVIGLLVLFFRRIPIMMALKPIIPDIKTWREALFAGHFGPIGVGAIFVAILARAELETEETTPLAELPPPGFPHRNIIELIWPITTFLVIVSIIVHGSSIAVFTLGKHINTLTFTMSYTTANDQSWMERLPRMQSRSKSQLSLPQSDSEFDEKAAFGPGMMPVVARTGGFLRRQKEEDNPSKTPSRSNSKTRHSGKKHKTRSWEPSKGSGGPITASAFGPPRQDTKEELPSSTSDSDTLAAKADTPPAIHEQQTESRPAENEATSPGEIFEEGDNTVYEDEEGNVLAVEETKRHGSQVEREAAELREGGKLMHEEGADANNGVAPQDDDKDFNEKMSSWRGFDKSEAKTEETTGQTARPGQQWRDGLRKMSYIGGKRKKSEAVPSEAQPPPPRKSGPARAYQFGNTLIIEDEDGEVIKKYEIPGSGGPTDGDKTKQRLGKMSKMLGLGGAEGNEEAEKPSSSAAAEAGPARKKSMWRMGEAEEPEIDDNKLRMNVGGRRMSTADFIDHIRTLDPKTRVKTVEDSNAPEPVKREARKEYREQAARKGKSEVPVVPEHPDEDGGGDTSPKLRRRQTNESATSMKLVDSNNETIPFHDVSQHVRDHSHPGGETAAERRRRIALQQQPGAVDSDSEDDGTERVPPSRSGGRPVPHPERMSGGGEAGETAAERRRRLGALGLGAGAEGSSTSSSESEGEEEMPRQPPPAAQAQRGIRFAEQPRPQPQQDSSPQQRQQGRGGRTSRLRWGKNTGR